MVTVHEVRQRLGLIWGKTTTLVITVSGFVAAASHLDEIKPFYVLYPWLERYIAYFLGAAAVWRLAFPPPEAVTMRTDDDVRTVVNPDATVTTTITKPIEEAPILVDKPAGVTFKEAREKV